MIMAAVGADAMTTGVYRTAITLKNGTQEILPDTAVQWFTYTHITQGTTTRHLLNVIKNGEVAMTFDTDSIAELDYGEMTYYEQFAGDWWLVASPNGEPYPGTSIMKTEAASIPYHAVLPAPGIPDYGKYIYCHIDSLPHRKGLKYDAHFKLRYAFDEAQQQGTIAMVLDDQQPITTQQYGGDASTYACLDATTTWYNGVSAQHAGGDTGNRYMYFVTHNLDNWALEARELPATWKPADQLDIEHEYNLPVLYEICWVVGLDIPFVQAEGDLLGYIDIFSSPRLMRHPWVKPLVEQ